MTWLAGFPFRPRSCVRDYLDERSGIDDLDRDVTLVRRLSQAASFGDHGPGVHVGRPCPELRTRDMCDIRMPYERLTVGRTRIDDALPAAHPNRARPRLGHHNDEDR